MSLLTARSRKRIAFVTDTLFSVYQSELRKAFERSARSRGYDVVVVIGRGIGHVDPVERAQNAVYDWLSRECVDGVVVLSSALMNFMGGAALEALFERLGALPKVSIGVEVPKVPSVTVDNRAGMRAAVDHLIEAHGCQRIGYLAGPEDNPEARARLEGYRYALGAHCLPFEQTLVEHGPFTLDGGAVAMQRLLARTRLFDAVVAANDAIAVGASQRLSAQGLPVPQRVRLIAFDDSPLASSALLASVAQPFNQLALQALNALENSMERRSVRDVAFCPRLALRRSCGCGHPEPQNQLPAFEASQPAREYVAAHRELLAEWLQELNESSFDWWSMRAERLLAGVEAALCGRDREFKETLDALVVEALQDGAPVEQIARSLRHLQRHFEKAPQRADQHRIWNRALSRLATTLAKAERKRHMEGLARSVALRDSMLGLWSAEGEAELAERLTSFLPRLGISRAFLGVLSTGGEKVRPLFSLDASHDLRLGGRTHGTGQLLPTGFGLDDEPSTLLLSPVNFGVDVRGVWACDGATDIFVFEQLRTQLGAVFELMALRRALSGDQPSVPAPTRIDATDLPAEAPDLPAETTPPEDDAETSAPERSIELAGHCS